MWPRFTTPPPPPPPPPPPTYPSGTCCTGSGHVIPLCIQTSTSFPRRGGVSVDPSLTRSKMSRSRPRPSSVKLVQLCEDLCLLFITRCCILPPISSPGLALSLRIPIMPPNVSQGSWSPIVLPKHGQLCLFAVCSIFLALASACLYFIKSCK